MSKEFLIKNQDKILEITFPAKDIARIRARLNKDIFTDKVSVSIVYPEKKESIDVKINAANDDEVRITPKKTDNASIVYNKKTELIKFYYDNKKIANTIRPVYNKKITYKKRPLKSEEQGTYIDFWCSKELYNFYGLGEKAGKLEKTGEDWVLKNNETYSYSERCDSLYASIPFFLVITTDYCFGIFLDQIQHSFFDFAKKNESTFTMGSESPHEIDFYFIFGGNPNQIIKHYYQLTGFPYLQPRRSLGHHQCRWSYKNEKQMNNLMSKYKRYQIPCDMIYFDIDYMDKFKMFTINKKAFPDLPGLLKKMKREGFYPVFIFDPGIKEEKDFSTFEGGKEKNIFLKDSKGLWRGKVWAEGFTVFPDFFKKETRTWWTDHINRFVSEKCKTHIDVWNDMNEIAHGLKKNPVDVFFTYNKRKLSYQEFHNAYALMEARASADYAKQSNRRTFILSRAGFSGIQRYAGIWTGDNWSNYCHLKMTISMMLNLSLSGIVTVACDGLGFGGYCTPGAAIRWTQAMCLLPTMRFHSRKFFPKKEPWSFGRYVLKIIKKYIRLRYTFIPYLYNLAYKAHSEGGIIIKPLFFNYFHDHHTYNLDNQYLVGDYIIVAPVVTPFQPWKKVYLPDGKWIRFDDKKEFTGKKWYKMWVPFSRLLIFIKKGSIIPRQNAGINHIPPDRVLFLYISPPEHGEITEEFFDDNGVHFDSKPTLFSVKADHKKVVIKSIKKGDSHFDMVKVMVNDKEIGEFRLKDLDYKEFIF